MFHGIFVPVYQGYCDGDFMFGLIQLVCAPTPRLSYVCNAYTVTNFSHKNLRAQRVR